MCKLDGFILVLYCLCFYICRLFVDMVGYGVGWLVLLWQHVVCSLFCTQVCDPFWVLIPKLKESRGNTSVLTSVLVAIGELAQVPGPEMHTDDMLQVCLVCLVCLAC